MEHYDSVLHARMALRAAEAAGVDPERVLAEAGVPESLLAEPLGRLPLAGRMAVFATARRLTRNPGLALAAGALAECQHFDMLGYAMAAQPTLGEAEALGGRLLPRVSSYLRLGLHEADEGVCLRLELGALAPEQRPDVAEYLLALLHRTATLIAQRALGLLAVRFRHPRRADAALYASAFGAPAAFGQPHDELVLPPWALALPCPNTDLGLATVLTGHLLRTLHETPVAPDVVERVRAFIDDHALHAEATLETAAGALGLKPRTLQHRLQQAGTSFTRLLDAVRRVRTTQLLARPEVPIAEVAYRVGFADLRGFYRAFRRWHGRTPQQWRVARGLAPDADGSLPTPAHVPAAD